jgi:hypothetical protein
MHSGRSADGLKLLPTDTAGLPPRQQADFLFLRGLADWLGGRRASSLQWFRRALRHNPYHIGARTLLVTELRDAGKLKEARKVGVADVAHLELGGLYHREIRNMLAEH